jgi:hypothetical protein
MPRWTYEVRKINTEWISQSAKQRSVPSSVEIIEGYLNGMDEMGWELVGFIPGFPGSTYNDSELNNSVFHVVFRQSRSGGEPL